MERRLPRPARTALPAALLAVGLAVGLAAGVAACAGPSTRASVPDFCAAMPDWWVTQERTLADGAEAARGLGATGTPSGTPARHREAFEAVVAWGADDEPELNVTATVSDDVRDEIRDFDAWAQVTCATGEVAEEGASVLGG